MLRELADEGEIDKVRKTLTRPGNLPPTVVADITARDADGELLAVPTEWKTEKHGETPTIRLHVPRRTRPAETPGIGDRALLRIEPNREKDDVARYTGRIIKLLDRARAARARRLSRRARTAADGSSRSTKSNSAAN